MFIKNKYKTKENLSKLKVKELKEILKYNNFKISGKKEILINRLWDFINNNIKKENISRRSTPRLILIEDYDKNRFYKKIDLIKTLNYYNFKNININTINKILNLLNENIKNTNKIIKIQKLFKKNKLKLIEKLRGPAFKNRNLSINDNDFLTFSKIENKYFYSFKDIDNFIYSFDIRSLNELINLNQNNPYNRKKIPEFVKKKLKILLNNLKTEKIPTNIEKIIITDPYQKIKHKVFDLFQKIDMLDNYTDINWFLDLNIYQLKNLYKSAEDIWNYRIMIDPSIDYNKIKKRIIPNNDIFLIPQQYINSINNKIKIQNIILDDFNKLVSEGIEKSDKILGAMWVLTALVEVSKDAAFALPHLIQIN